MMSTGLWRVASALNIFRFFRFAYGLGLRADSSHFPIPKKGYDISSFRFPAMTKRYMWLRIGAWFGKRVAIFESLGRAAGRPRPPSSSGRTPGGRRSPRGGNACWRRRRADSRSLKKCFAPRRERYLARSRRRVRRRSEELRRGHANDEIAEKIRAWAE